MFLGLEAKQTLPFRFFLGLKYPSNISDGKKGACSSFRLSVGSDATVWRYLSEYRSSSIRGGISNGCAQVNTDLTIRFDCLQDVIWGLTQAGDEACLQFAYLLLLCGEV